jgi:Phage-related protein
VNILNWLTNLFKRKPNNATYAQMLTGGTPIFSQFGTNIYASDVVQQAINCIVLELKKLTPTHIREIGNDCAPINSNIQNVLNNPNELMSTCDFIEKIAWNLFLNYNAFVVPIYYSWVDNKGVTQRHYTGIYPIQPQNVDFIEDASGRLFIKFRFGDGSETTLPYSDVIHLRRNYSVNDFMGGNESGQPDNYALLQTLQLNSDLLHGVSAAMKSSFSINGVVKYNTLMDDGKTENELQKLEAKLKRSESGFLPLDLKADFREIKKDVKLVDADTLKFIDEKILRNFGVPLSILTGDYTKAQYEAFYQKTLEPIINQMSQEFTRIMLTDGERSFGNKIVFYPKNLIFMSISETLEMIRLLGDSGGLYENEKRVSLGLRPLKELEGVRMQSLNYVSVDLAAQYQTGGKKSDTGGTNGGANNEEQN